MISTQHYEFQAPSNMNAIRSSIMQRIIQRKANNPAALVHNTTISPLTPPSCNDHELEHTKLSFSHHLDNGLPSPPIETCIYEEPQQQQPDSQMVVDALMELNNNHNQRTSESAESIREKIRLLNQEKHELFQAMKGLLSKPSLKTAATSVSVPVSVLESTATATTATLPVEESVTTTDTIITMPFHTNNSNNYNYCPTQRNNSTTERSKSISRDFKQRPSQMNRSRSISHTEFSRPASRYSYSYSGNNGYSNNSQVAPQSSHYYHKRHYSHHNRSY